MAFLGLHFPFEDSCVYTEIKSVCFPPVDLSYVTLILRLSHKSKKVKRSVASPTLSVEVLED